MNMKNQFTGQRILVMGYGISGKSVVNYLLSKQANVILNDRGDLSQDPSVHLLIKAGVKVVDGGHPLSLLEEVDLIVKSPVIPYQIDFMQAALAKKIPIITDVELAYLESSAPIIGITGSNGKTTTSSLIQTILDAHHNGQVKMAGNIGIPALDVAQSVTENDLIVMELSSFQLMGIQKFRPKIAVFTNIYEAHLDYHGNRQAYIEAKLNLIKNLTDQDYLVYNADQAEFEEWFGACPAIKVPFSRKAVIKKGLYLEDQHFYYQGHPICPISLLKLPGDHNIENALAALAVAKINGVLDQSCAKALANFSGIPHRIQPLGEFNGVTYYNDSKATNTVATITALKSFDQEVIYLGGGLDRGNDFKDLIPYLNKVKAAFLFGQSKDKMEIDFKTAGVPKIELYDTLDQAAEAAFDLAKEGQVVLFSPACASWDQYVSYEVRGQHFIDLLSAYRTDEVGGEHEVH